MIAPLPHAVRIYSQLYTVRWGSSTDPDWDATGDEGMIVHGQDDAKPGQALYTITIHPKYRGKNRARAWEILAHEILHAFDKLEPKARSEMDVTEWERVTRHTWKKWKHLPHALVYQLDVPLGRLLSMGGLPCACVPCGKKRIPA